MIRKHHRIRVRQRCVDSLCRRCKHSLLFLSRFNSAISWSHPSLDKDRSAVKFSSSDFRHFPPSFHCLCPKCLLIIFGVRYNLWQMINLYSLIGCVRIKGWVCTYKFATIKFCIRFANSH
uniref:Uncharacterized protein n=1 Tax=Hyaloperonospora arabidopsidis (strain Emoy2) TaxID=559515 RepID=M4BQF2_HYAAE